MADLTAGTTAHGSYSSSAGVATGTFSASGVCFEGLTLTSASRRTAAGKSRALVRLRPLSLRPASRLAARMRCCSSSRRKFSKYAVLLVLLALLLDTDIDDASAPACDDCGGIDMGATEQPNDPKVLTGS